jgi:hypothetical protein
MSRVHPKLFGHNVVMTENGRHCERFVRSNLLIFRNLKIGFAELRFASVASTLKEQGFDFVEHCVVRNDEIKICHW